MPQEPPRYRCCFCSKAIEDRDDIPRHEAHCELKDRKTAFWKLMITIAQASERKNGQ